jgi:hypothetical protein
MTSHSAERLARVILRGKGDHPGPGSVNKDHVPGGTPQCGQGKPSQAPLRPGELTVTRHGVLTPRQVGEVGQLLRYFSHQVNPTR